MLFAQISCKGFAGFELFTCPEVVPFFRAWHGLRTIPTGESVNGGINSPGFLIVCFHTSPPRTLSIAAAREEART